MRKFVLPFVLSLVIALLLLAIGWLWAGRGRGTGAAFPGVTAASQVSAHTIVKEVLPIGEYASLAYHYTSVVKDINTKDIKGWNIPFTTRKYIFTYDGVMKLGIDASTITVMEPGEASAGEGLPVLRIVFPPIQILSHEIIEDSIEVFEQSQTIFNEIKLQDAFRVTADRKLEIEKKALEGGLAGEARASLEQQFGALLRGLPGIRDGYAVEFAWEPPVEVPPPGETAAAQ
jgi:hypothetical protein